jgi:hypothetical protein
VEKAYWYDLKNDGRKREYNEHNFGVVWHEAFNLAPKPAAAALSVFARLTAGAAVQTLWQEGAAWAVLYRRSDGTDLAVAWAVDGERPLAINGEDVAQLDLMGNAGPVGEEVTLSETPLYLTGRRLRW